MECGAASRCDIDRKLLDAKVPDGVSGGIRRVTARTYLVLLTNAPRLPTFIEGTVLSTSGGNTRTIAAKNDTVSTPSQARAAVPFCISLKSTTGGNQCLGNDSCRG